MKQLSYIKGRGFMNDVWRDNMAEFVKSSFFQEYGNHFQLLDNGNGSYVAILGFKDKDLIEVKKGELEKLFELDDIMNVNEKINFLSELRSKHYSRTNISIN